MSVRQPNELPLSAELLNELFRTGEHPSYRISKGIDEAKIVGARYDPLTDWVVLEYDRPVDEIAAVATHRA